VTLRFPYQAVELSGPPPPSLPPDASARWRPLVPIRIAGPSGLMDFGGAVLDSGSDDTLFSLPVAEQIGVALLPQAGAHIYRGRRYFIQYGQVQLELNDGSAFWSWSALVGFSEAKFRYPLLGQAGCLEFVDVTFKGKDRLVLLETNDSFSGQVG
jgi:hypothetical protein